MFVTLGEMRLSSESMQRLLKKSERHWTAPAFVGMSDAGLFAVGCTAVGTCLPCIVAVSLSARLERGLALDASTTQWEIQMPLILWLLGVPLTVVILLMLFHVI